jgi:hypothetical protein
MMDFAYAFGEVFNLSLRLVIKKFQESFFGSAKWDLKILYKSIGYA